MDYSYVETESLKPGYVRDGRVYDVKPGQVREGVDLPRDPLAPANSAATHPVRHRCRGRGESRQRDPASDGGRGVRRVVPLRLRGAAHLARPRSHVHARAVDQAGHQSRRRTARPVRRSLDGRHGLSGVDVLELRAHPRTGDPRQRASSRMARAGSSGKTTSRPSTKRAGASPWSGRRARTGMYGCRMPSAPPRRPSRGRARRSGPSLRRPGTAC